MNIELISNISLACFLMVKNHMKKAQKIGLFDIEIPPHISVFYLHSNKESVGFDRPQIIAEPPFETHHPHFCGGVPSEDWAGLIDYKINHAETQENVGCVIWGSYNDPETILILIKNKDCPLVTLKINAKFLGEPTAVKIEDIDPECALGFALHDIAPPDYNTPH